MTGPRQAQLLEATNILLNARRTCEPIHDLPQELQPATPQEAFWIQDQLIQSFGQIGGWKVGAPTPEASPLCAPMPKAWMAASAALLASPHFRFRGLEVEVAFLLGRDLPARAEPYTEAEVTAAIQSCHPAIEILESGLLDPTSSTVNRLSQMADLQMHGGFVFGPACDNWQTIDFTQEPVTLAVDGVVRVQRTGSNTSGNLMRLLPWLANDAAARTGGLRAGQWITTGSWTGVSLGSAYSAVDAEFTNVGRVSLSFA